MLVCSVGDLGLILYQPQPLNAPTDMAMGWVDPWVGLGWVGLGRVRSNMNYWRSFKAVAQNCWSNGTHSLGSAWFTA